MIASADRQRRIPFPLDIGPRHGRAHEETRLMLRSKWPSSRDGRRGPALLIQTCVGSVVDSNSFVIGFSPDLSRASSSWRSNGWSPKTRVWSFISAQKSSAACSVKARTRNRSMTRRAASSTNAHLGDVFDPSAARS